MLLEHGGHDPVKEKKKNKKNIRERFIVLRNTGTSHDRYFKAEVMTEKKSCLSVQAFPQELGYTGLKIRNNNKQNLGMLG